MSEQQSGPTIGIVSMGEAGNLGDDLILISTVDAIHASRPEARINFLGHGVPVDWSTVARQLGWPTTPHSRSRGQELPGLATDSRILADSDLVIFGGGGLLQNSHSRHEPYQWLSALPRGTARPATVAVGLGLGPFNEQWTEFFTEHPAPFDLTYVRDTDSLDLAQNGFGWDRVGLASDLVTAEFLDRLGITPDLAPATPRLGVAVRAWPGLTAQAVARRVSALCKDRGIDQVALFVIEDKPWDHVDLEFTQVVADLLPVDLQTSIEVYDAQDPVGFTRRMAACTAALSMKFHSSIVWAKAGVDIAPIVYAPKVAALFGLPYRGLEIGESTAQPVVAQSLVSARDLVSSLVRDPAQVRRGAPDAFFSPLERFTFRSGRLSAAVQSRIPSLSRGA